MALNEPLRFICRKTEQSIKILSLDGGRRVPLSISISDTGENEFSDFTMEKSFVLVPEEWKRKYLRNCYT